MQITAASRKQAEIGSNKAGPISGAALVVINGPAIAPVLPPAAIKPNRRRAWVLVNRSAMKLQNTETTNRLNTLSQIKKALAVFCGETSALNKAKKISKLTAKKM